MNLTVKAIVLLFVFAGCSDNKEPRHVLAIDPTDTRPARLSEFISNYEFLKLSTSDNSFIGDIDKLLVTDTRIYVLDPRQSIALYVYNRTGELEFKIANYGRGPGEFMGPYDFAIDDNRGEIIIFDARALKLCYYSIIDGSYIKEVNLDFQFFRFMVMDNTYIFFLNNIASKYEHNILITDKELNTLDKKLKLDPNMIGYHFALPVNFSRYENKLLFTAPSDYNIYTYNETNGFSIYKYIDFGNYTLPASYYGRHPNNQSRRDEIGNSAYHVSNYFETDKFLFFKYSKGGSGAHYYIKSKITENIIHVNYKELEDDIGVGPLIIWPNAIEKNTLVWFQEPGTLLRYLHKTKDGMTEPEWAAYTNKNRKLISFAQTLSAEDNPYLIFTEIDF